MTSIELEQLKSKFLVLLMELEWCDKEMYTLAKEILYKAMEESYALKDTENGWMNK